MCCHVVCCSFGLCFVYRLSYMFYCVVICHVVWYAILHVRVVRPGCCINPDELSYVLFLFKGCRSSS